jgi:hypothetical protein
LLRGGRDGRTAVAAIGKAGHWEVPMASDIANPSGLCDWKCTFLQWIAGSIFMNYGYLKKHNKIKGLGRPIPCDGAGI